MNTNFNTNNYETTDNRDYLQDLFDTSFLKMDTKTLRSSYQKLRKLELKAPLEITTESVDISFLVENLALACDIICTENGKSFIFCGNDTSMAKANQKLLTKAILNLLSNSFLYGYGNLTTIKTIEKHKFISIEIQNEGFLPQDFNFGDGLSFVKNVCNALNGHFFISTDLFSVKAIMLIPKSQKLKSISTNPDFCELLSDRLSPVYVEFFGIK